MGQFSNSPVPPPHHTEKKKGVDFCRILARLDNPMPLFLQMREDASVRTRDLEKEKSLKVLRVLMDEI